MTQSKQEAKAPQPTEFDGFHAYPAPAVQEGRLAGIKMAYTRAGVTAVERVVEVERPGLPHDEQATADEMASLLRKVELLEAVCRFINIGGSIEEAKQMCEAALGNIVSVIGAEPRHPIVGPPWRLLHTANRVHTFYEPMQGVALVWDESGPTLRKDSLANVIAADSG